MKTLLNKKTAAALALCLSMSVSTFGQSQVIHLTQNKATVSSIIKAIEKQTQMSVDFSQNTINVNKTVSLKSKSETLGELMNQILKGNGNLTYKIVDRHIIIVKAGHNGAQPEQSVRQGVGKTKITGRVLDNNGEPIIGASVVEQGTKNGTVTDIDGNFVLSSSKENPTLDISYIGFLSQQVKARGGATINVTMKENAQSLEELVVVGYGSQKKVNVIGSIATVDSKSLEARSASDVSNMLTGQMSGVTITQTSGNPGQDGGTIRVRGVGSFGATPSPLVLVDGMPGSLSDLSPDEIDNISVLKDASSAAIYGSRAANGVVLVTTKRGKEGRTKVSYNGSVGFSKAAELPEMAHSYDYAKFYNMAIGTDTYTAEDIQKYKDGSDPDNYADENYLDKLFGGHSFLTKHTLNVNGGNERVQYMATAGYLRHDGLLKNNYYNKYNVRLNLNAKITKDLSMGVRLNGMASDRHEPSTPGQLDSAGYEGIMLAALRYPGLLPSYMSDGSNGNGLKGSGTPVAWVEKCASFYRQDFDKFCGNLDLTYKPIKGLTLKGIGGYKYSLQHVRNYRSEFVTASGRNNGPSSLSDDMYRTVYKTFQATADYNTTIAKKHTIDVLVGYTWEDENQRSVGGYRQNFPSNDVPYLTAGGADGQTNFGGGYDWAIQSVFGRLTYNYDERYLFEATMRYDGSSRFPTDSKYGFFPSAALGWRVSEEKFWKDSSVAKWFTNLKIKASTGVLGNNNIGNYPYQSVYTLGSNQNYVFGGVYTTGASITTYVDPNLKWEKTRTSDIGIETGFFQNRLTLNATYFYRKTTDVLYKPSASYSSIFGLNVSQVNTGAVENKGFEFEAGYRDKVGGFNYWVNGNFSIIKNKVITLGMGNVTQANGMVGNGSNLFIGYPMQMYYGYKTDGVFLTDEEVGEWYDQSAIAKGSKAGDIRYVDLDGDHKVTPKDMTYLGSSIPKYTFGLSFGGDYKGFDFSVLLQGVAGVKGRLNEWAGFAFFQEGNIQKWQMEECWNMNPTNRYPKYPRLEVMSNAGSNNTLLSDYWILDASFVKVRNIQFGYKLPKSIISKVGISSMRAYISMDNPFSFNGYRKGWDPENTNNRGSYYPVMSSYTFGLTLAF